MDVHQPRLTRVLGQFDLTFFLIAALVNLNSVPLVAGSGPSALLFWLMGFVLFFLPQMVAVLELSHRYPQEGGIYQWTKTAFGDFHGFISGWCYWTNNIFYVPTLLFYIVGFAAFLGGEATAGTSDNPAVMAGISLVLLMVITAVNIRGLNVGKWVQNVGATGTFITTALILGVGLISLHYQPMANVSSMNFVLPRFGDWGTWSLLSVVCLNYVGLELGSVMGDEIKQPRITIPRAAVFAGLSTVVLYLLATFSLLATIPAGEIGVIDGILQGVQRAADNIGMAWVVMPIALLMILNAGGNTSAWLAGSARIPFVIGIDRYLPAMLGRLHPRYATPYVALVVQAIASALFIVISAVGATVHDMYMTLLQTTIVLQLIPYLYMFVALVTIRLQRDPAPGYFRSGFLPVAGGVVGFLMTAFALVLAFVPSHNIADVAGFELKLGLGILGFLVPAVVLFRWNARRISSGEILAGTVEVAPD